MEVSVLGRWRTLRPSNLTDDLRVFALLAQKAFRRNLEYRASHVITNVGSIIFGFIFIAIWQAATASGGTGEYSATHFAQYVGFNQAMLWITLFRQNGLGIPDAISTGAISIEMMRPIDFHTMSVTRELGNVWYSFWFRTLPLATVFSLAVGVHVPQRPTTILLLLISVVAAAYIGLCLHYIVGLSGFWTIRSQWAIQFLHTAHFGLSGFMVPVDLLPGLLAPVAAASPFATLQYYPARIYLELSGAEALYWPLFWTVALTVICRVMTHFARRKLEVQGG